MFSSHRCYEHTPISPLSTLRPPSTRNFDPGDHRLCNDEHPFDIHQRSDQLGLHWSCSLKPRPLVFLIWSLQSGQERTVFFLFLIALIDRTIMKCLPAHSKCNLYNLSGETDVVFTSDDRQTQLADINAFEIVKNIIGQIFWRKKTLSDFNFHHWTLCWSWHFRYKF